MKGIQGLSKLEEKKTVAQQKSSEAEKKSSLLQNPSQLGSLSSVGDFSQQSLASFLPTRPPGRQLFCHKPSLITELYPPGVDKSNGGLLADYLCQGNKCELEGVVLGQMLPFSFLGKPCPVELKQWLFQLVACSSDPAISSGALRSLTGLLQNARRCQQSSQFSAPSVSDLRDVLVSLGAEPERLRPAIIENGAKVVPFCEGEESDEVFLVEPPSMNLINITNYIAACVRRLPGCYSVQDLEDLVLISCSLSLDNYCASFLKNSLCQCIQQLLAAYPDSVWQKAVKRLSPQLLCLSQHHHDRLSLAQLIGSNTQRQRYLTRDFCRQCLVQMLGLEDETFVGNDVEVCGEQSLKAKKGEENEKNKENESDNLSLEDTTVPDPPVRVAHLDPLEMQDCAFVSRVIEFYHKNRLKQFRDEDYYKMYSLLLMLQILAPMKDIVWTQEDMKSQCLVHLRGLASSIDESPNWPIRSLVKNILICMRLELPAQGSDRKEKQTEIVHFYS